MLFLVAALFVPLVRSEAQTVHYWVEPSCDRLYALRGQSVALSVKSNSSSPRVQIYDPSNTLIYNQVWGVNQTRNIPISPTASYGTYTVKAIANSDTATTWLTVLKIDGWSQITEWPHIVEHKNFQYSFNSDFSLTVENSGDSLSIDFGFLRELRDEFSLDLNPLQNGMNVLLRFTKGAVEVDIDFAFIHSGAKIIVNGTIPQPRTIGIDVSARALKNYLKGLRSGNIVFDWSDISQAFSYADGRLSVQIPQSFHVDPAIFSDGFESNDFTAWTGTQGSPTVVSDITHHGTYAMQVSTTGATTYVYKTFTAISTAHIRAYYRFDDIPAAGVQFQIITLRNSAGGTVALIELYNSGGTQKVYLFYYDGADKNVGVNFAWATGQWYCLELRAVISGAGAGEYRFYIDGVEEAGLTKTGLTNNGRGNVDLTTVGLWHDGGAPAKVLRVDCVVVDSSYIGLESTAYTAALSQSASMSVAVAVASVFHVPLTQSFTTAKAVTVASAFHVPLTQGIVEAQGVGVQSAFNVALSDSYVTSLDVSTGSVYSVGLSQEITSSSDITVSADFHVAVETSLTWLISAIVSLPISGEQGLAALAFILALAGLAVAALGQGRGR